MYIYILKLTLNINEINKKTKKFNFLPYTLVNFPENYVKIFISDSTPQQISKEHELIYNNYTINMYMFKEKLLVKNFEKIREFFYSYENCPLLYYCKDFNTIPDIFKDFHNILQKINKKKVIKETENKEITIYHDLKNVINEIESKYDTLKYFEEIEPHFNPCQIFFENFTKSKNYEILYIIHERDDDFKNLIEKLQYKNNSEWKKDIDKLKNRIKNEEYKKLNLIEDFSYCSILNEDKNISNFYEKEVIDTKQHIVVIIKELFSKEKKIEYNTEKIKILEKAYFSEFQILNEYIIPEDLKIIKLLESQINKNMNIDQIENILYKFNQYLDESHNKITIADHKQLLIIKRKRLLKDYLYKHTIIKEKVKISISQLFNNFLKFLTIHYPGCNNYFHNQNFTIILNELGYKTQRKTDGIYCLNLQLL